MAIIKRMNPGLPGGKGQSWLNQRIRPVIWSNVRIDLFPWIRFFRICPEFFKFYSAC